MKMGIHGRMAIMKLIVLVCLLAFTAVCGCTYGPGSGAVPPQAEVAPTIAAMPTAELLPTAQALPTLEPSSIPRSSADPLIGTWRWLGENNTEVVFSFKPDGTFRRQEAGTGPGITTGTWKNEGGGSYRLVYDNPGFVPEHIAYHRNAGQLDNRSGYFSRA